MSLDVRLQILTCPVHSHDPDVGLVSPCPDLRPVPWSLGHRVSHLWPSPPPTLAHCSGSHAVTKPRSPWEQSMVWPLVSSPALPPAVPWHPGRPLLLSELVPDFCPVRFCSSLCGCSTSNPRLGDLQGRSDAHESGWTATVWLAICRGPASLPLSVSFTL